MRVRIRSCEWAIFDGSDVGIFQFPRMLSAGVLIGRHRLLKLSNVALNFLNEKNPCDADCSQNSLTTCFFTARRHASAVYVVLVCLSACLSQVGELLKRLYVGSHKSVAR